MNIALLGLPGAGKTTVGAILAQRLNLHHLALGDLLRQQSHENIDLRDALARGDMAPESLVEKLIGRAASPAGVVLDGFPRHAAQLPLALQTFPGLRLALLDVDLSVARSRIASRSSIERPEDSPHVLDARMRLAHAQLADLEEAAGPHVLWRIGGNASVREIVDELLCRIDRVERSKD